MAKKRNQSASAISLRRLNSGGWVFVHPRAVLDRSEDMEEVRTMLEEGELEIAVDELRWLLSGCSDFMAAHALLGELAIEIDNDIPLARGHFGFAYDLGQKALRRHKCQGPLPGAQPANAPFHEAARGLAFCLEKKEKSQMADEIAIEIKKLDPTDPAGVAAMLDELRTGGAPVVGLSMPGE